MPDVLQVLVNTAQRRLSSPRLSLTAEKFGMNGVDSSNAFIEPVAGTIMLRPAPLFDAWNTSSSGIYSRLTLANFSLTTGWFAANNRGAGAVRLCNPSGMSSSAITAASYGRNRPFYVSFYAYSVENQSVGYAFECGWDSGGSGVVGVSLRFRLNGTVEVWKDGVQVGEGTVGVQGGATLSNVYADYLIIPFRRRDILIYSLTAGDGFIHTFTDIDEDEADPTITADEPFWFLVQANASVNVELAPVQFPSTGYVTSLPISLSVPPPTGATLEPRVNGAIAPAVTNAYLVGDQPYIAGGSDTTNVVSAFTVVKTDGTSYTPNGIIRDVLAKFTMTGDGQYSPFVYGVTAAYAAEFEDTDDSEEFDITPYIMDSPPPVLSVPDDPGGTTFTFSIKAPETIQSADVPLLMTLGNRPVKVLIGPNILIDGVMLEPEFRDALYDDAARLEITVRDAMFAAQNLQSRERIPLDGLLLSDTADATNYWASVIQFFYYQTGILNTDMDIGALAFTIPAIPLSDNQEAFSNYVEIGSTWYDEIARVVGTYASGFAWRIKPQGSGANPKAIFKDPDALSTTPDYILYRTEVDAIAGGGAATDVYWSYSEIPLPIEANEVRATGYDPRTGQVLQAYKVDTASQDVTLAPSAQPVNWLGQPRVFGIIDPRFTSQTACNKAVESIYPRVVERYYSGSFECQMLFKSDGAPVWPSDYVQLVGRRSLRITAMNVTLVREASEFVFRSATYTGGTIFNRGGGSPWEVHALARRASINKTFVYPGGDIIARGTPAFTVEVP